MYKPEMVARARRLAADGLNTSQISQATGVSRFAIREWLLDKPKPERLCPARDKSVVPVNEYVYLLGLYLGDGCISVDHKNVAHLRIACTDTYPNLIDECARAMCAVLPNKVGFVSAPGYVSVNSYSKHWPCLFPQHGLGKKHDRLIQLETWQQVMVDADPWSFLRGLVHSDGCRSLNTVNGRGYVRYTFSNASDDIKKLFTDTCDYVGVVWRRMNAMNISIAQRASVDLMDRHIGSKG